MSEYQSLHFLAVDRPLDDKQLAYMEKQSSRAEVSRWEFSVEYHYSDFRGKAVEMLRRGYDVHLHFANFGIRKLMFRLPELPCDKKTFAAFELKYLVTWTKDQRGKAGVLSIQPEGDGGCFYEDYFNFDSLLRSLPKLREMLMQGDLRPLYMAWLACVYDDESTEPPVPAGLGKLDGALEAMAEFYEISPDLIAAAAEQSPVAAKKPDQQAAAKKWVNSLSKVELKKIVSDLVTGNAAMVQADVLSLVRGSLPATLPHTARSSRTLGQLNGAAEAVGTERKKRDDAAKEKARKKQLKLIAADPNKLIRRIDTLVSKRTRESYRQVTDCLTDLSEALGEGSGPAKARQIAQRLRQRKPRSNILISVLKKQGWID